MGPVMDRTAYPVGRDESGRLAATKRVIENIIIHDSSLISHLDLIDSLKSDATPQNVSQIMDSAQKLVHQFALLKEQLASIGIDAATETKSDPTQSQSSGREKLKAKGPRITTKSNGKNAKVNPAKNANAPETSSEISSKKRSWDSDLSEAQLSVDHLSTQSSSRKRPRTRTITPGANDAVEDFVPVALQKDDISEEVERRLQLKEERRKKSSAEPEKKRKRDSTSSKDGNGCPETSKNRLKRSRDISDVV